MRSWRVSLFTLLLLVSTAALSAGQSLAEVARREAERRKAITHPARVYTNEDVSNKPLTVAAARPESDQRTAGQDDAAVTESAEGEPVSAAAAAQVLKKDEAWWRDRLGKLREQVTRSRLAAEALQTRVSSLTAELASKTDDAERAPLERSRTEAMTELARVADEMEKATRELAELEQEAARAGVPPGWLRD